MLFEDGKHALKDKLISGAYNKPKKQKQLASVCRVWTLN